MSFYFAGKSEYSEKEFQMFVNIGYKIDDLEFLMRMLTANAIYNNAARKCFVENLTGPAVESLRRCLIAWDDDYINRCTPEWDSMITLEKL